MKILHLLYESRGDYFGMGGVGTRAYEIYSRLMFRHDITLLCRRYPGARDGKIDGLKHIFVGTESKSFTKTLLSYAYQAVRFVKKYGNHYDLIIEEFSPAIPTFLHFFAQKPVVLQLQGYTGKLYFKKYNPAYALTLYFLEKLRPLFYDNFIFISKETIKRLRLRMPLSSPPVTGEDASLYSHVEHRGATSPLLGKKVKLIAIIPNSISPELFHTFPEENNYILYLGRIDIYAKGLDTLIEAYKDFCISFPKIKLLIAGDGREMNEFREMLSQLPDNPRKNIELLGWVSGGKKADVIRKAMFVVFPSRHEVQGITALEQMACGKAIIVSDIPELSYITKSGAGISFKTGSSTALAQSMKDLANRKNLHEMGQKGRSLVKDLTWDRIAVRFEEFLNNVLENEMKI